MSTVTAEQLDMVRQWAAEGVDLNGIQKRLASECGVHMIYMDVRFLLLDHGIEIATAAAPKPEEKAAEPKPEEAPEPAPVAMPGQVGRPEVTLDELALPNALISGKVKFSSGVSGAWQVDQFGRLAWSELTGELTPEDWQAFQMELRQILSRY
jgi:hypothetical protein